MAASSSLRRVLSLWRVHARMDLLFVLRGWREALAWYLSDVLSSIAGITATFLLAARFDGIGSWSLDEVLFMLGFGMCARSGVDFFFAMNVGWISRIVGRGQLDHRLVQPQPLWMAFLTEGFTPFTGSGPLLTSLAVLGVAMARLDLALSPAFVALLLVNAAAATAILLAFAYAWGSLAFWAPRGAEEINSNSMRLMNGLSIFPLDGLAPAFQVGLLSAVPAGFAAWFPARALLGRGGELAAWATPLAAVAFAAVAVLLFRRGLRHYHHTGSVRYLDYGHRR